MLCRFELDVVTGTELDVVTGTKLDVVTKTEEVLYLGLTIWLKTHHFSHSRSTLLELQKDLTHRFLNGELIQMTKKRQRYMIAQSESLFMPQSGRGLSGKEAKDLTYRFLNGKL